MSGGDERLTSRVVAGRYRLERELGRGGMGVVWLAVDTLIERRVALKELRAPAGVRGTDEASFVERALREARNAGRLNHPGVVAVHDVIAATGDDDSVHIVMEYVEAPTLGDLIDQQGPLPAPRVAAMGAGILEALTAAHTAGIVHRDIKPSNVLVQDGDLVKLTDFGIALAAEDTRLTRSGVMGTHAYLAPEAFDSGEVGPAADLWALGATLFHAVAGRAPFERDTSTATLRAILFEDPPAPPCPAPLAEVITGLLTRPVEQRLTGDAARQGLERAVTHVDMTPPPDAPSTSGGGQGGWAAQATTINRSPTATPAPFGTTQPPGPGGQTTRPGGPPVPFGTTLPSVPGGQTTRPGGPPPFGTTQPAPPHPAGFTHPGSGPGLPGQAPGPASGPHSSGSWAGSPPRRNNTPLIIGGVAAAIVLLLVVIVAASGGGSDSDDDGGGGEQAGIDPSQSDVPTPGEATGPGGPAGPAGPAGDAGSGEAAAQQFLDAVNSGDEDTAMGMLCPDNRDSTEPATAAAIDGGASLEIDVTETESDDSGFWARLAGTVDGGPADDLAFMTTSNDGDESWCVMQFDLGQG